MTYPQFALARQLLVEEHIGSAVREAKRREDDMAKQTRRQALRRER